MISTSAPTYALLDLEMLNNKDEFHLLLRQQKATGQQAFQDRCDDVSIIQKLLYHAYHVAGLTFPPGLSNHDRAIVHTECRKYGFTSKSSG